MSNSLSFTGPEGIVATSPHQLALILQQEFVQAGILTNVIRDDTYVHFTAEDSSSGLKATVGLMEVDDLLGGDVGPIIAARYLLEKTCVDADSVATTVPVLQLTICLDRGQTLQTGLLDVAHHALPEECLPFLDDTGTRYLLLTQFGRVFADTMSVDKSLRSLLSQVMSSPYCRVHCTENLSWSYSGAAYPSAVPMQ